MLYPLSESTCSSIANDEDYFVIDTHNNLMDILCSSSPLLLDDSDEEDSSENMLTNFRVTDMNVDVEE